nr:hypothetical protein [Comamonas koreensis]
MKYIYKNFAKSALHSLCECSGCSKLLQQAAAGCAHVYKIIDRV